jgi:hypothetical protein
LKATLERETEAIEVDALPNIMLDDFESGIDYMPHSGIEDASDCGKIQKLALLDNSLLSINAFSRVSSLRKVDLGITCNPQENCMLRGSPVVEQLSLRPRVCGVVGEKSDPLVSSSDSGCAESVEVIEPSEKKEQSAMSRLCENQSNNLEKGVISLKKGGVLDVEEIISGAKGRLSDWVKENVVFGLYPDERSPRCKSSTDFSFLTLFPDYVKGSNMVDTRLGIFSLLDNEGYFDVGSEGREVYFVDITQVTGAYFTDSQRDVSIQDPSIMSEIENSVQLFVPS